jgi:prevent-host-death family protein
MKVSTAEFIKNYGMLADKALSEPVTITKNGRDRLVMISAEEYSRLERRDRRVVKSSRKKKSPSSPRQRLSPVRRASMRS